MQTQPKIRKIDASKPLDGLFPSRFLKPTHLIEWGVTEITVNVSHLQEEEVQPRPNATEWKPVLYFLNKGGSVHPQGYLLSAKADKDALKTSTGAVTVGELEGKRIKIGLSEWKKKTVLRIHPQPASNESMPQHQAIDAAGQAERELNPHKR